METAEQRGRRYRRRILEISRQVQAAHVAPAFSCLEIVDALYHEVMRPQDIFIMSKGHGCLAQYVVLEDLGKIAPSYLFDYCRPIGRLGAHPDYWPEHGIHASTGSLGHGLGIAAGQALAERMKGTDVRAYVLLSDGECQEGSTWEAAMVAANLRLDNLVVLVDCNDFGGMERMSEAHPALAPIAPKFCAFGWRALNAAGHAPASIVSAVAALQNLGQDRDKPGAVVCSTVKGYPISFMCDDPIWHYRSPDKEEYERALKELEAGHV